jgi:hypothetical protein
MDIASLYSDTTTIEIKDPTNSKPIGITVEVRSPESDEVKAVQRAWQDKVLKSKGKDITAEDADNQAVETLIAVVASWEWDDKLKWNGKKPDNSDAFKREVLSSKEGSFILRQIDAAHGEEARFFANSVKT